MRLNSAQQQLTPASGTKLQLTSGGALCWSLVHMFASLHAHGVLC
jgi:hypothetical protein